MDPEVEADASEDVDMIAGPTPAPSTAVVAANQELPNEKSAGVVTNTSSDDESPAAGNDGQYARVPSITMTEGSLSMLVLL